MVVQFRCTSCEKPIEVDDEVAGRQVTCPYCHDVVDAPAESTYEPEPVARPAGPSPPPSPSSGTQAPQPPAEESSALGGAPRSAPRAGVDVTVTDRFEPWAQVPGQPQQPPVKRRNIVGFFGLALAVLSLVLVGSAIKILMIDHAKDLGFGDVGQLDQEEMKKRQEEFQNRLNQLAQDIDQHPWLMRSVGFMVGGMLCWFAGLVCSVIGMSIRYRSRLPAIGGLVFSLILPLMFCSGLLVG